MIITIASVERNTADAAVSDPSGFFRKDRLLPGVYGVAAVRAGFKTANAPSIKVSLDTETRVELVLQPGPITETLIVEAPGLLLKTDRADVSTAFGGQEMRALPGLDRNFTKFLLLTPGATEVPWQHGSSENPQASVQIMVNGQHFGGTGYQLDGTENRDPILGIIVINPNLDAVAEAKITSQNYDAEFGQATAGVVSVQTRSGSNELHGSVSEYYRSDRFQARNPFTQPKDQPLPTTERHQFGGSFGGPIRKDRLFVFSDYQGLRSLVGGSKLLTVPTVRARTGDLSEYGVTVFDPAGGAPADRQPFPGAIIPERRLSPQALGILALIPKPNTEGKDGGTVNNYLASDSETFDSDALRHEARWPPARAAQSVRPLQRGGLQAHRTHRVRRRRRAGIRHAGRHVEVAKPQPGAGWRRDILAFDGGGLPCRLLQVQGRCALRRLRDALCPGHQHPRAEPRRAQLGAARRIHRRSGGIRVWLWRGSQFL